MALLIGTDEAGYGPNLGPLTVTGTAWIVDDAAVDLYDVLSDVVSRNPRKKCITIADSKTLYSSSGSIAGLETSVLACLFAIQGRIPSSWNELVEMVCDDETNSGIESEGWLDARQLSLPIKAARSEIEQLGNQLRQCMTESGVELTDVKLAALFPSQFNSGIQEHGNKATLLSNTTLEIVSDLIGMLESRRLSAVRIVCDKHGGRSKYAALIQHCITNQMVSICHESLEISEYEWQESGCRCNARFIARGESFLPTALASMVSKYVREVFMELWNQFWIQHLPSIKPTKGYPQDAKRFKKEIATMQIELGISDDSIWRIR